MRQEALLGRGLRPQLGNLAIKRFELDAERLRLFLPAPVVLEAREPGELGQQRFMFSAGMLSEPALAHPADVAFFLSPIPRRIADQLSGGYSIDLSAAFQQRSSNLYLGAMDRSVAGALVTHRGEPRVDVNWSGAAVPGIRSKRGAGTVTWLGTPHKQWARVR